MHGMIMVIYSAHALFLAASALSHSASCRRPRHGFPYVNMLSYWIYLLAGWSWWLASSRLAGPQAAGWTLYPPQSILSGTPGHEWGIILMLPL